VCYTIKGNIEGVLNVHTFLMVILMIISLALIALVLLQPGKSAGLSGAIAGGAEALMGKKAKSVEGKLGKLSIVCAVLFLLLSILVNIFE